MGNFWKTNYLLPLLLIITLAAVLRFYGLNWDQNQHFHPDERMIVLTALKIGFPQDSAEQSLLFTPESPLNPKFFAYGSFPIYLLKGVSSAVAPIWANAAAYDGITLVGRVLSALFDLGTIIFLFLLGRKLGKSSLGFLAAAFYTLSVLPLQLSHFYAVDTPLTFLTVLILFLSVNFYGKPATSKTILIGLVFGLALATKTSALLLVIPIATAFALKLFPKPLLLTSYSLLLFVVTLATFLISEPFALIDFPTFWQQTVEQSRMTADAFTFPYTLQYVGKIPYWYELKNIFLWGLGPILATLSFGGILLFMYKTFRPTLNISYLIVVLFFILYFAVIGRFAVGFMRYMLPLYPLFCLFAAFLVERFQLSKYLRLLLLTLLLIWPLSFLSIYAQTPTRIQASKWIYQNIPPTKILATEHWDDGLPAGRPIQYPTIQLPLYEPDTPQKWQQISQAINTVDYIIIASNRLYVPLSKMDNCTKLPPGRCYKETAEYYRQLFSGSLGFVKVAEFSVYPTIPGTNYIINDFVADESFTVYDHPKVIIFKKQPQPI